MVDNWSQVIGTQRQVSDGMDPLNYVHTQFHWKNWEVKRYPT